MKTILRHIERVKEQPHHVRKQIAVAAAASGAALIALVWLVGSVATGAFSIRENIARPPSSAASGVSGNQGLAGAGAAAALPPAENTPARIEIIDATPPASASVKKAEQTILPF